MGVMRAPGVLVFLAVLAYMLTAEARTFTREGRDLQQMASPPMPADSMVSASAVKTPAPYLIDPWAVGMTYPDVIVAVGQGVEFKWPGRHGVYMLPNLTCPDVFDNNGPHVLSQVKLSGDYTTSPLKAGTYYFACQVPGHCESGQIVQVTAS